MTAPWIAALLALIFGPTLAVVAYRYTSRDAVILRARRRDARRWRRVQNARRYGP